MVNPENLEKGYVIVFRSMIDHEGIGFKKPFSKAEAWIWLIMNASHKNRKEWRDFGGKERLIETPRGSLSHSYRFLSQKWGWSKDKVIRFLSYLQDERMISSKRVQQITQISICKYDSYQNIQYSNKDSRKTAERQQKDKDNTLNTLNTLKTPKDRGKKFTPPTIEEVKEYIKEKNYSFDAEGFHAYYESKGWYVGKNKMTNWKMACVTWQRNENERKPKKPMRVSADALSD